MYEAFNDCGLNLDILNHCQEFLVALGKHKTRALNWYFFYFLLQLAVQLANISLYIRNTSFTLVVLFVFISALLSGECQLLQGGTKARNKNSCLFVAAASVPISGWIAVLSVGHTNLMYLSSCIWASEYVFFWEM